MLVVSFINSQSEFENALNESGFDPANDVIYDLSSSNIDFKTGLNILYPVLDFENITAEFLNDYEKNLKRASADIFQYCFWGYPLYWMIELSEKHPYNIPYRLFLMKNDLLRLNDLANKHKEFTFFLPAQKRQFKPIIEQFLKEHLKYSSSVRFINEPKKKMSSFRYNLAFVRNEIKKFKQLVNGVREALKKTETNSLATKGYIFTYSPGTWDDKEKRDYGIGYINDQAEGKLKYIPFIHDKNSFNDSTNFKLPSEFVQCFPSKMQTFLFCFQYAKLFFKVKRKGSESVDPFKETAQMQMEVILEDKLSMLFFRTWLINFFKSIKQPVNIFYQDEFYLTGRIISDAAKVNAKVNAYGVQHGLIFANHTVYFPVKEEVSGKFKIPMPKRLLVWGEYFKEVLIKYSAFPSDNVIVIGNLKFKLASEVPRNEKRTNVLLWCTGLPNVIGKESKFVLELMNSIPHCSVIVRMHPLHNVEKEVMSSSCYNNYKERFSFSKNPDIQSDFQKAGMVLSTSSSGVVLEATFAGKVVIAIPSDFYIIEKINHPAVFQPQNPNDLVSIVPEIKKTLDNNHAQKSDSLEKIVYTKPDVLNKILNFELAN